MKIHAVRGSNLASLAGPFEVDFRAEPLGSVGLFAITGPTGSGKSTLLDAICLALFSTTPRLNSTGGAKIGRADDDDADRLAAFDVRGLLHRGTSRGHAEVDFEGRDGRRYRARWEVRRARDRADGRVQQATASLTCLDDGVALGGKVTETLDAIREKVGLSFDQFRRSVLLAQGDFAAFLHAKAKERAELLEKVTGTGIYARISQRAFERSRAANAARDAVKTQLGGLAVASDEARAALEAERDQLAAALETRRTAEKAAELAVRWFEVLGRLEGEVQAAIDAEQTAQAAVEVAAPRRALVARVARVQRHAGVVKESDDAVAGVERAQQALADTKAAVIAAEGAIAAAGATEVEARGALEATRTARAVAQPDLDAAAKLDALIADATPKVTGLRGEAKRKSDEAEALGEAHQRIARRIDEVRRQHTDASDWLAANTDARPLAEAWEAVQAGAKDHADAVKALATATSAAAKAATAVTAAEEAHAGAARALSTRAEALTAAVAEVSAAEGRIVPGARAALSARRSALTACKERAAVAVTTAALAEEDRAAAANEAETAARASTDADTARRVAAEALAALPAVQAKWEEAGRSRDLARAAMDLDARRADLRDGEDCPLCGSREHPWAHGRPAIADDLDQRVHELDNERQRLEALRTKASAEAFAADGVAAQAEARRKGLLERLAGFAATWAALDLGLPALDAPTARAAATRVAESLAEELVGLETDERALDAVEAEAAAARTRRERAQRLADDAGVTSREAEAALQRARDALRERTADKVRETDRRDGAWLSILRAWPAADAVRDDFLTDPTRVTARWAAEVDAWRRESKAMATASEALAKLEPDAARDATAAKNAETASGEARIAADVAAAALESLRSERARLLGGRTVETERARLDGALRTAETSHGDALQAVSTAAAARTGATATAAGATAAMAAARARAEAAAQALATVLGAEGVHLDALRSLLLHDGAWVAAEQRALTELDAGFGTATAVVNERQRSLAEHEKTRPEGLDAQTAGTNRAAAGTALRDALEAHQAAVLQLAQDDAARRQAANLVGDLAAKDATAKLWGGISDVIGSADGSKFRKFAQGLTLDALLVQANHHLGSLAPRYRLERVPGEDLELQVLDRHMGDEIRALPSLSGGETFLASLALALGLATLSAATTPVESLFIDEGFGTLDRQTLETAMAALDALQAQGRQVGIISHVEGLAEHVGVQIRVEKLGDGRSRVHAP